MRLRFGFGALSNRHHDLALVPIGTPHKEYLPRYARILDVLELAELYHQPDVHEKHLAWFDAAPPDFLFTAKLWKRVTHPEERSWGDAELAAAGEAWDHMAPLRHRGCRFGPLVAQFPPRFVAKDEHQAFLADLVATFPQGVLALELRHASWWDDPKRGEALRGALERRRTPLVWSTYESAFTPPWQTGEIGYVRFTGRHHPGAKTRGRPIHQEARLDAVLEMRARLHQAADGGHWQECAVIVTNPFEGNAVDSIPRVVAALGEPERAERLRRHPGEPLLGRS